MTESQERRAAGVQRVAVARVVDICGRDATVPAFEAQSVELSGRGMHVKTPYLPPPGAPLVCRLEEGGREIIVEGVVAWVKDVEGGGEFGMRFTALDSGSVETLKELCGMDAPKPAAPGADVAEPATKASPATAGTAVKLHIDGLGAPMKARVKDAGSRKLQVGSNLEFLKVGRGLEVENLEEGERRGAKIDAVSIAIDPATQVPQLVVVLRYEGADTTPEPSVVGAEETHGMPMDAVAEAASTSDPMATDDEQDDGDFADSGDELRDRVDAFAADFGKAAQKTGKKLASASGKAASHFMKWARVGAGRLSEAAARRHQPDQRRSTSPAPTIISGHRKLRPQNGVAPEEPSNSRRKLMIAAGAGALVLVGVVGIAMASHSGKSDAQPVAAASVQTPPPGAVPNAAVAANLPPLQPAAGAQGAPVGAAPGSQPSAPAAGGQRPGVVANVPLFGPTPMATLEPAPLGPPPEAVPMVPGAATAAQGGLVPPSTEERMDEETSAHDESFDGADKKDSEKKTSDVKPEDVKPWGEGAMHLPVVYRLKLDEPGAALKGTKQARGFTVVIPHRKVLDSGSSVTKRDDRISEVRTKNGPDGAHVTFTFRSKVPTFKVRLRKSYVEFFVSAP